MTNTLALQLQCDYLVAKYALTISSYQSVEAAVDIIFGTDEFGCHRHPFVGYRPSKDEPKDDELGQVELQCFIC